VLAFELFLPLAIALQRRFCLRGDILSRLAALARFVDRERVELSLQLKQLLVGAVVRPQLDAFDDLLRLDAALGEEADIGAQ